MLASIRSNPKHLGLLMTVAGAAALLVAHAKDRGALAMSPGVEGCLTVGVVAVALALADGVRYSTCLLWALPVFVVQFFSCRAAGESALAVLGVEGVLIGVFGMVMAAPRDAKVLVAFRSRPVLPPSSCRTTPWRGGRVAEGTRLLSVRSGN